MSALDIDTFNISQVIFSCKYALNGQMSKSEALPESCRGSNLEGIFIFKLYTRWLPLVLNR